MSDITKPKKSLFVLILGLLAVSVAIQIYFNVRPLLEADGDSGWRVFLILFWVLFFVLALLFLKHVSTLRLRDDRIETPKVPAGMLSTPWSEIRGIEIYSGRMVMLEASKGRVVVNLSMFECPQKILQFIVDHLPEDMEVPTSVTDLIRSR